MDVGHQAGSVAGGLAGADACQRSVRIEGSQLAAIGLHDAAGDLAPAVGQPGLVVTLLEELQGSVDYLITSRLAPGIKGHTGL